MRIIAGKWKGRVLAAPAGLLTRPVTDRVREAIFDMLGARLAEPGRLPACDVLDLFAGLNLGVSYGVQRLPNDRYFSGTVFAYGAVGGIDLPLIEGLALQVFWEAGGMLFRLDQKISQHLLLKVKELLPPLRSSLPEVESGVEIGEVLHQ